jgi:hypothetical protein
VNITLQLQLKYLQISSLHSYAIVLIDARTIGGGRRARLGPAACTCTCARTAAPALLGTASLCGRGTKQENETNSSEIKVYGS